MSIKITTNQNTVTVADADKSITIINNNEPNRIDVVQPVSNTIYVAALGPQGPSGVDTETDPIFVAWSGSSTSQFAGTASFATTASYVLNIPTIDTSSLVGTGSFNSFTSSIQTQVDNLTTATSSYVLTSVTQSMLQPYVLTSVTGSMLQPYVLTSATSSMIVSGALTASYYQETDPVFTAVSGTFALTSSFNTLTSSFNSFTASYNTGSFTGSFSGSFYGTASWATNALTASYVNPLVQNVTITGSLLLTQSYISSVDYIDFNTSSLSTSTTGRVYWNDVDGTLELGLKGGVVKSQLGQGLVTRVVNKITPNVDLLGANYQAVVVSGAQGQRLAIKLAQADNDANSASTLGLVAENIARNEEGFIVTVGLLKNIDTTGALQSETWNDGDILYLSPTTAGRITNIKPQAPQHTVIIGYVEYAHQNQGKIYVKIDNGYEIDELHNIRITTASLSTGQLLSYSGSVWVNTNQLTGSYGLTGSLSFANGGITGSLYGTASWADYVVNAPSIDTSAFVTTSSFNSFTSSYNTGSFTGSFTGNLTGTASWATQALTASFLPVNTYQITSSWAEYVVNGGNVDISGLVTTSSFNAFTSSINSFTSSYNTGSFTGSFSGSFYGTSSWAQSASNALTASYISTLYSSNYSASFGSSTTWTINHNLNTRYVIVQTFNSSHNQILPQEITLTNANTVTATFSQAESGYAVVTVGGALTYNYVTYTSPNDMLQMNNDSSTLHDLIFLETDDTWYPVDQSSNTSATRMLAINSGSNYALIEGYITVGEDGNASGVPLIAGTLNTGAPVYIKEGATSAPFLDTTIPTTGIVRLLGHLIQNEGSGYWFMKFRPDHTWVEI